MLKMINKKSFFLHASNHETIIFSIITKIESEQLLFNALDCKKKNIKGSFWIDNLNQPKKMGSK